MATETVKQDETTTTPDHSSFVSMATWQTESILQSLLNAAIESKENLDMLVCGMVPRLLELNALVMTATDSNTDAGQLQQMLYGGWHQEQQAAAV